MMKKIILFALLATLMGCSSEKAPSENDPNALPPGIMQPVAGTGAVEGGSWLPEVQQQSMPDSMK